MVFVMNLISDLWRLSRIKIRIYNYCNLKRRESDREVVAFVPFWCVGGLSRSGGAWWALGRLAFARIAELGRDYGLEGSDSKRQRKL